jgi:hypothetical protein
MSCFMYAVIYTAVVVSASFREVRAKVIYLVRVDSLKTSGLTHQGREPTGRIARTNIKLVDYLILCHYT